MIWRTTSARIATWFGFVLMCLGMFMAILDIQVVATSLPAIQHALGISPDAMSWIQTAYLIAEITAIPLTDEQRAQIAEVRNFYEAKIAEQKVLHESAMRRTLEPAERDTLVDQHRRELEHFTSARDAKIEKIRRGEQA